ncbi:protein mono-ADP-ribosyltransferase PARP12b isoform X2 [Lampris incognitus]|uniref:protein mono-ADP-ribosyltransferase PARP12b isoform X2 n=1 Tax=Lampris incognitus TaxID=2546036 RepID=UPI0024B5A538|nr:protein mono-ADP-ribosyltransferase PARP12b isoform X2 [Lampris incognitus]
MRAKVERPRSNSEPMRDYFRFLCFWSLRLFVSEMSSYTSIIHYATSVLCGSKGAMVLLQLHRKVFQRFNVNEDEFWYIVKKCPRFVVVKNKEGTHGWGADCTVVAKTSLRLCKKYSKESCVNCQELHLCKYFVYGNCRYGKGRKPCRFSHDIRSEHNYPLLRECTLHELNEEDLFLLLLQNDPALLPEVCSHYNKGTGMYGTCTFKDGCTKLHLCQHFVQGYCMFGHKCMRQHVIDQDGCRMLEERGLGGDIIHDLPLIYQNIHQLTALSSSSPKDSCIRVHFNLPYKWEVFDGDKWKDLRHMEEIERAFCDPRKTQSPGARPVDFLTMRREADPVRRLSTVSSVTKPPHYILTTEWLWYYKGDHENWIEYGKPDDKQRTTSVTSRNLEEVYMTNKSAEIKIVKGHRHYYLSFQDMYQRNPKHNTKRRVRRRPRFISIKEMEEQIVR